MRDDYDRHAPPPTNWAGIIEAIVFALLALAAVINIPAGIKILSMDTKPTTPPPALVQPNNVTINKEVNCPVFSFGCGGKESTDQESNHYDGISRQP